MTLRRHGEAGAAFDGAGDVAERIAAERDELLLVAPVARSYVSANILSVMDLDASGGTGPLS